MKTDTTRRSVFNEIPSYHVTVNMPCDFMHDVSERVAQYDITVIINCLINKNYFSHEDLNNRLSSFEYDVFACKNTPPVKLI